MGVGRRPSKTTTIECVPIKTSWLFGINGLEKRVFTKISINPFPIVEGRTQNRRSCSIIQAHSLHLYILLVLIRVTKGQKQYGWEVGENFEFSKVFRFSHY